MQDEIRDAKVYNIKNDQYILLVESNNDFLYGKVNSNNLISELKTFVSIRQL